MIDGGRTSSVSGFFPISWSDDAGREGESTHAVFPLREGRRRRDDRRPEDTASTLAVGAAPANRPGAITVRPAGTVTVTGFGAFPDLGGISAVRVTFASPDPGSKSRIEGLAGFAAAAGGTTQAVAATELPEVEASSCEVPATRARTAAAMPFCPVVVSSKVDGLIVATRLPFARRNMLHELRRNLDAAPAEKLGFVVTDTKAGERYGYGYRYRAYERVGGMPSESVVSLRP